MRRIEVISGMTVALAVAACAQPEDTSAPMTLDVVREKAAAKVDSPEVGYLTLKAQAPSGEIGWAKSFCTGTLIAPRVVLTAAHCIRGIETLKKPELEAQGSKVLGLGFGVGLELDKAVTEAAPGKTFEHPLAFASPSDAAETVLGDYDVGYVILASPIPSDEITPATISMTARTGPADCGYTVIGYGRASDDPNSPKSRDTLGACRRNGDSAFGDKNTLFVETLNGTTCHGDSGGPLLEGGLVYGVLSSGLACDAPQAWFASSAFNAEFLRKALTAADP